jgi:serine/threonine-protein kinase RsbW
MKRQIAVSADAAHLPLLTRLLQEFWSAAELPAAEAPAFELALEEIFVNVVMHGAPAGRRAQVEVSFALDDGDLTLMIEDDGPPFDPLSLPPPDVTASLEDRKVGGLGVFLVRKTMDAVGYRRIAERNQLSLRKRVAPRARH